ncbi:hypothetical protein CGRA01v4_13529 [Colletotrichum graminicola]|nr:hypothetical protein CGRA01v4_13529 [Colletotrichum graminicola]
MKGNSVREVWASSRPSCQCQAGEIKRPSSHVDLDARCAMRQGRAGRGECCSLYDVPYRIVWTAILMQLVERGEGEGVGSGITRSSSSFWGGVGGKEDQDRANQGISGRAGQITYDDDDDDDDDTGGAAGARPSADEGIVNCEKRETTTPRHVSCGGGGLDMRLCMYPKSSQLRHASRMLRLLVQLRAPVPPKEHTT